VRSYPYAVRVCKQIEHCVHKQVVASALAPQTVSHIALSTQDAMSLYALAQTHAQLLCRMRLTPILMKMSVN
jgi:hypothetical protein